jgi:UDP-N-acetylglucosamine 2-epimerase (non-hydrolysing)
MPADRTPRLHKVLHVVGARPNFMKAAPVMTSLGATGRFEQRLVHTGQHYDDRMAKVQLTDLGLPRPDWSLNLGAGPDTDQVHNIEARVVETLGSEAPDLVVVYGDVNSTLAAARAAVSAELPVAHIEAGLRSFDRSMPEEVNRIATDRLSSVLLTSSREADDNLMREGVPRERIHFVGNVMIDTLLLHRTRAPWQAVSARFSVEHRRYAVLTLHRPANVDNRGAFAQILARLEPLAREFPIVFPVHPRTARQLSQNGLADRVGFLRLTDPLGYLDFVALMDHAACVLTDSGGIQEETTVLGVPCFTLRDNTERPVTIEQGTNMLVGANARDLPDAFSDFQRTGGKRGTIPEKWDGAAAARIAPILDDFLTRDLPTRPLGAKGAD